MPRSLDSVNVCHRENGGTLGMVPSLFNVLRSPLKGDIPNNYTRCMWGWLLRVPSHGYHHFPYENIHVVEDSGSPQHCTNLRFPQCPIAMSDGLPHGIRTTSHATWGRHIWNNPLWNSPAIIRGIIRLPSLKLTASPWKKRKIIFQPSIFRDYVSFREGRYPGNYHDITLTRGTS